MKKTVDISKYINADIPEFVLFGKTYAVKNDKKTILLLNEMRRKAAESNGHQQCIEYRLSHHVGSDARALR